MKFQIPNKPIYQPPAIQIQSIRQSSLVGLGSIFAPMYSTGPCKSCGNSK